MDPSFGGGVFLRSACKRLVSLGGAPSRQVRGAEVDSSVHARISVNLHDEFGITGQYLLNGDFFKLEPDHGTVDAVVGNPPFVRYQKFNGETRKAALAQAAHQGVHLSELSSSWAPFIVHSVSFLKQGGRLAMVAPFELCHAAYARPVLSHLVRSFGSITLLTFRKKLFPELNEDTLLVLADKKGAGDGRLQWHELEHAGELATGIEPTDYDQQNAVELDASRISKGQSRLIEYLIPEDARGLYRELKRRSDISMLGALADVGIGYVTGANDYFHLSDRQARERGIPDNVLRPAVRRGRSLTGLRFTHADWLDGLTTGDSGYLLHIQQESDVTPGVREYLRAGEDQGVPKAYKCRTRKPWYSVPFVHMPDGFLTYMSGHTPRLVANEAGAVAPNTLHILRMHGLAPITCSALSALWQTSLTRLSAELEGHALGGGMLKVEPTEAEKLLVPVPGNSECRAGLAEELDDMLRKGNDSQANELADRIILEGQIGLTPRECETLREAGDLLRNRRCPQGAQQ